MADLRLRIHVCDSYQENRLCLTKNLDLCFNKNILKQSQTTKNKKLFLLFIIITYYYFFEHSNKKQRLHLFAPTLNLIPKVDYFMGISACLLEKI